MNKVDIIRELQVLVQGAGLLTCSIVDISTGMVIFSAGESREINQRAEAATDYWRLYQRSSACYLSLGPLQGISVLHKGGTMNIFPCGAHSVLVTIAERGKVDWTSWPKRVATLNNLMG